MELEIGKKYKIARSMLGMTTILPVFGKFLPNGDYIITDLYDGDRFKVKKINGLYSIKYYDFELVPEFKMGDEVEVFEKRWDNKDRRWDNYYYIGENKINYFLATSDSLNFKDCMCCTNYKKDNYYLKPKPKTHTISFDDDTPIEISEQSYENMRESLK